MMLLPAGPSEASVPLLLLQERGPRTARPGGPPSEARGVGEWRRGCDSEEEIPLILPTPASEASGSHPGLAA